MRSEERGVQSRQPEQALEDVWFAGAEAHDLFRASL